ncbi:MAG: flavodoxin family protein, partial [Leptospirales bacterium]|nr:flavodoxin family protein [Leptospirales bacterium]
FLNQFAAGGFKTDIINAYQTNIKPCTGCGYCASKLQCSIDDGMSGIYTLIKEADIISVSSPLYFSSFPAPLKTIIDRCQLLWEEKKNNMPMKKKRGFFFALPDRITAIFFAVFLPGLNIFLIL